jgi:protein arginine kinase activator
VSFKCQYCSSTATVHLTDIIDKKKRETHLCEECARGKKIIADDPEDISIPNLLQLVLGHKIAGASELSSEPTAEAERCPECGTVYSYFRAQGRLGCPHDYETFRKQLEPLLTRVHQTARHSNSAKMPARHARRLRQARRVELEAQLVSAVKEERYEEAARLRDSIRQLGELDESQ